MPEFATTPPIPYVPISEKAAEVRAAINAPQLSSDNSFGGLQKLAIPGPFATDTEASTGGVPDDNLYYRSDGTVRAASHISLDLAFALDKTLTARTGPTPVLTRSSTGTFIGSNGLIQSAAIDAARFDHDPITGVCKGLLIEEPRTNLVLQSEGFNTASWLKSANIVAIPVVTLDQAVAPSGLASADKIELPAVTGANAYSIATQSVSQTAGLVCTSSVYLRGQVGGEKVWISWTPNGTTYVRKECILTTSWQRFDLTYTSASGANFFQIGVDLRDPSQSTQSAQTIFAWGAQLEVGAFPTSYIPTTVGTAARSADVCSITGADFNSFYNNSAGTIVGDLVLSDPTQITPILFRSFLNEDNKIQLGVTNTAGAAIRPFVVSGGTSTYSSNQGTTIAGSPRKVALAYAVDDAISCLNGTLGTQDGTVTPPTGVTVAQIGSSLTGTISRIQYFKKRLSNAKLQTITTL